MSESPYILREMTVIFSKDVIAFCKSEQQTIITRPLIDQLIRAATSIGANYAEASNAASKSDLGIRYLLPKRKQLKQKYWLALLLDVAIDSQTCNKLAEECHHLLMTFQKIVNTLNTGSRLTDKVR